jgi:hypothetical protein
METKQSPIRVYHSLIAGKGSWVGGAIDALGANEGDPATLYSPGNFLIRTTINSVGRAVFFNLDPELPIPYSGYIATVYSSSPSVVLSWRRDPKENPQTESMTPVSIVGHTLSTYARELSRFTQEQLGAGINNILIITGGLAILRFCLGNDYQSLRDEATCDDCQASNK